jgi:hypothetical protein
VKARSAIKALSPVKARFRPVDDSATATEPPAESSVFSPEDDLGTLWVKAYQGEVSGEVLFGRLSELVVEPDHRRRLDVLRELEARTKAALVPAMEHHGLPTDADPDVERDARALADASASLPWSVLMEAFEPITTQFIALYTRIGALARPEDRAVADLLVAHEEALRAFARLELAGQGEDSLGAITSLPHMR